MLLFLAAPSSGRGESTPGVLTNAAQVRALSFDQARTHMPVRLRGVVTGEGSTGIVIQDSTAGIFIYQHKLDVSWAKRGDLVEVNGAADPGEFAPVVWPDKITKLGTAPIPEPRHATLDGLASGALDAQWVEVSGIVRASQMMRLYEFKLILAIGGMRLPVQYFGPTNALGFVDAEVRVTGICFYQFNRNGQILNPLLMVPGEKYLKIEKPAPSSPFTAPLRKAQNVLQFTPEDTHRHRVRVRGTVLHQIPGETVWLHDGGHGLRVESPLTETVNPGDQIETAGFPASGDCSPVLEDAVFHILATATNSPQPIIVVNKSDALQHDADLIRLSAQLLEISGSPDNWNLTLQWQNKPLRASLHKPLPPPADWVPGSLVQLTGICRALADSSGSVGGGPQSPSEFQLLLRSIADVTIVQKPPWWTARRIVTVLILATSISLLAAALIAWQARQRLQQQALRRTMAEMEFSAMFAERNRIAREIHDTLAQGLGAISMHLEMVKDQLGREPEKVSRHLEIAHQTARQSLTEARESIWNMRSHVLENGDLGAALEGVLHQFTDGTATRGQFITSGTVRRLASTIENNLLRIGQEAISNAVKHARAKTIAVTLEFGERHVALTVTDDGSGFNPAQPPAGSHFGLLGQRERTAQMGGKLDVQSAPGTGTKINVWIPTYD
ncbi:MAG: sensor histidine kinase [Verrucomicrobiota bacterium]